MTLARLDSGLPDVMAEIQERIRANRSGGSSVVETIDAENARLAQQRQDEMREQLRHVSGIPPRFTDAKLETTHLHDGNTSAAAKVRHLIDNGFTESLALYGNEDGLYVGNGKTHLACAIANAAIKRCIKARFITAVALLEAMHEASRYASDADVPDIIKTFGTVPVLILDDLGREQLTRRTIPWLEELLNRRWNECKPMVITTNLDFKQIYEYFFAACIAADQPESTAAAMADRLRGIIPMNRWVKVVGRSQRGHHEC